MPEEDGEEEAKNVVEAHYKREGRPGAARAANRPRRESA